MESSELIDFVARIDQKFDSIDEKTNQLETILRRIKHKQANRLQFNGKLSKITDVDIFGERELRKLERDSFLFDEQSNQSKNLLDSTPQKKQLKCEIEF